MVLKGAAIQVWAAIYKENCLQRTGSEGAGCIEEALGLQADVCMQGTCATRSACCTDCSLQCTLLSTPTLH